MDKVNWTLPYTYTDSKKLLFKVASKVLNSVNNAAFDTLDLRLTQRKANSAVA